MRPVQACLLAVTLAACSASVPAADASTAGASPLLPSRTYWVGVGGSDSNPGTRSAPFRTIQRGVDAAGAGDTVLVSGGTYRSRGAEMVRFRHGGFKGSWLTLAAAPGAEPVLRGSDKHRYGIVLSPGVSWVRLSGLTLRGFAGDGVLLDCKACAGSVEHRRIRLESLEVSEGGTAFRPTNGSRISVVDSWFHDNLEVGIDCAPGPCNRLVVSGTRVERQTGYDWSDGLAVESGRDITIVDSVAGDNAGDGFDSKADGTTVVRSISWGNARDGIKLWHGDCEIRDSISARNGLTGVVLETGSFTLANVLVADGGTAARSYGMTVAYDGGPATTLAMFNTIFAGNNGTALYVGEPVTLTREDHDLFDAGAGNGAIVYEGTEYSGSDLGDGTWGTATGLGAGTGPGVPSFTTDYRLDAGSPGVDTGTGDGASSTDLDGAPRPQGGGFDIGPFER